MSSYMDRGGKKARGGGPRGTLPRDLTTPAWTETAGERPDLTMPIGTITLASPSRIRRSLNRTRWVYRGTSEKVDLADAVAAWEELGGRVDRALVLLHEDGAVTLGPWRELLPETDRTTPPTGSFRTGPGPGAANLHRPPANPQDPPTPPVGTSGGQR